MPMFAIIKTYLFTNITSGEYDAMDVFYWSFIKKTSHKSYDRFLKKTTNPLYSMFDSQSPIIWVILKFSDFYPSSLLSLDAFSGKLTRDAQSAHGFAEIQLLSQVIQLKLPLSLSPPHLLLLLPARWEVQLTPDTEQG